MFYFLFQKHVFSFNLSFVQIMEYWIEENFSGEDGKLFCEN